MTLIQPGHLVCLTLGFVLGAAALSDRAPRQNGPDPVAALQQRETPPPPPAAKPDAQSEPPAPQEPPSTGERDADELSSARDLPRVYRGQPMSEALIASALQVACDIDAEMGEQLMNLHQDDPDRFERMMRVRGDRLVDMAILRERDPELYQTRLHEMKIDHQVLQTGQRLCQAIDQGRAEDAANLERELRGLLMQQAAFRIKARGDYINALDEKIAELQEDLTDMAENMMPRVEQRIEALKGCERDGRIPPE